MARFRVFFDQYGTIVSVVETKADRSAPPAGLLPMDGVASLDARLNTEETVLQVHAAYRVDLSTKQPKLVRVESPKQKSK